MWYDYALSSYPKYPSSHFKRQLQTLPFLQLIALFNRMSWLCRWGPEAKQALQQGQSKDALHHTLWCCDGSRQWNFAHFQKVAFCSNPSSYKVWYYHVVFKHHSDAQRKKIPFTFSEKKNLWAGPLLISWYTRHGQTPSKTLLNICLNVCKR